MKINKRIISLLVICMMSISCIPSFAAETPSLDTDLSTITDSMDMSSLNTDSLNIGSITNSLDMGSLDLGGDISLDGTDISSGSLSISSDSLSNTSEATDSTDQRTLYTDAYELTPLGQMQDMQTAGEMAQYYNNANTDNFESINLQFEAIKEQFSLDGWGSNTEIEIPQLTKGYSTDLQATLNETFSSFDIKTSLDEVSIPDSFSVSSMMEKADTARSQIASQFENSDSYQKALSAMSLNKSLANTKATLDTSDMQSKLQSLSSTASANNSSVYNQFSSSFESKKSSNISGAEAYNQVSSYDYDSAVSSMKSSIAAVKASAINSVDSVEEAYNRTK